jgi:hypothetical protein
MRQEQMRRDEPIDCITVRISPLQARADKDPRTDGVSTTTTLDHAAAEHRDDT